MGWINPYNGSKMSVEILLSRCVAQNFKWPARVCVLDGFPPFTPYIVFDHVSHLNSFITTSTLPWRRLAKTVCWFGDHLAWRSSGVKQPSRAACGVGNSSSFPPSSSSASTYLHREGSLLKVYNAADIVCRHDPFKVLARRRPMPVSQFDHLDISVTDFVVGVIYRNLIHIIVD